MKHIKGVDINYIDYGEGKNTIVLLHGWGQNIEMMKPVGDKLQKNNSAGRDLCQYKAKIIST